MKKIINIEAILAPIPGENPVGESLRYDPVYDEIKEARRADDILDRGDWQQELKISDWHKVLKLSVQILTERSKDLQIAVWLFEALTNLNGFAGVKEGLEIINGLLNNFWDNFYPEIEDDDLDYRVMPLEFLNDKLWLPIKEISLTDISLTPGYSWLKWQDSRQVGAETDAEKREKMIADGKLTIEDFDGAVNRSSKSFYENLGQLITASLEEFHRFDAIVDEKFGREAPRLAELKAALEDCNQLVSRLLKIKQEQEPDIEQEPDLDALDLEETEQIPVDEGVSELAAQAAGGGTVSVQTVIPVGAYSVNRLLGSAGVEEAVWNEALAKLNTAGIKQALEHLLGASCSAQSVRENSNFRLLTAKLCLKAHRPDLAKPIAEGLISLVEELGLVKWESPIWIADVIETLYQCLTTENASDDDQYRARELLTRLCTLDVTKAMEYTL